MRQLLQEYHFELGFKGREQLIWRGVAWDMFSAFFEEAYEHLFDGSSLLCPIVHPEMDVLVLKAEGFTILRTCVHGHMYPSSQDCFLMPGSVLAWNF